MADSRSTTPKPNTEKNSANTSDSPPRDRSNILATVAAQNRVSVPRVVRDGVACYVEDRWHLLPV